MPQHFPDTVYNVPDHVRPALELWIREGRMPGDFLRSVLENDLRNAVMRADHVNAQHLKDIIDFLNMEAPSPCWGSRENVLAWALRFAQETERQPCAECGGLRDEHDSSRRCEGFRR